MVPFFFIVDLEIIVRFSPNGKSQGPPVTGCLPSLPPSIIFLSAMSVFLMSPSADDQHCIKKKPVNVLIGTNVLPKERETIHSI